MVMASPTSADSLAITPRGTWFYAGAAIFALLFSVAAFGPSLVHTSQRLAPPTALAIAHGFACLAWLVLFLVQSILARRQRLALHRRLGGFSVLLATAIVFLGYQTALAMGRRGFDLSGDLAARSDPLASIAFPLLDTAMFALLFVAAFRYRKRPAIHKRLMLFAVFGALMPAPVAHLLGHYSFFQGKPFLQPVLVGAFLAIAALHDRITQRRIHPVSLWVALTIFSLDILCASRVAPSTAWHNAATRLVR
jgi:hypothetical protein